jgi:signal transduction histidine kinase
LQIESLEREKVLYEIAMAIGNTLDIQKMGKEVLHVLLKKLSATSAAIFYGKREAIEFSDVVVSIPRRIQSHQVYEEVLHLMNREDELDIAYQSAYGSFFYLFPLNDFGYLVLIRDDEIEALILHSLKPIMEKVTTSLHACALHGELQTSLEKAKSADKAKSQFLANMSHEIRTPLNGIVGFLNILKESNLTPKQQHYIDVIDTSTQTLLQVINDILDFSKIEAGELNVEHLPFDLHNEFSMLFELFSVQTAEKGIHFSSQIDVHFPSMIISDKVRLKQIMVNLINNAIKFTHVGHVEVTIEVLEESENSCTWKASVNDTGVGIAEEKLALILEPFKQSNDSVTREYGGTGLGLSITRELIELLGGKLEVHSTQGEGSQFAFILTSAKGEQRVEKSAEPISLEYFKNTTILVAEDNLMNQILMSEILQGFNINFDIAENGQIAYDKFKYGKYDLVLMDHNMPILDGEKALKRILEFEKNNHLKHVPVVVLTANALHGDKERFMAMGFDAYLPKPIEMDSLKSLLHQFLS